MKLMKMHATCLWDKTLRNVPHQVPMELFNEEQAKTNHGQSLDKLNERGGLGILEMLDNIHKRKLSYGIEKQEHVDELNVLIEKHLHK